MNEKRDKFLKNYKGPILDDFSEDFLIYNSIKRIVNSYARNPSKDKIHTIYNKIVILSRCWDPSFLYPEIINNIGDGDVYKTSFLMYIINELFGYPMEPEEVDEDWEEDILTLIGEKKIIKMSFTCFSSEAVIYLNALKLKI